MSVPQIVNTCINILYLLAIVILFFMNVRGKSKTKSKGKPAINIEEVLMNFIEEVEASKRLSGTEKKMLVTCNMANWCNANNIKYDNALVSEMIEKLIRFSKKVNADPSRPIEDNTSDKNVDPNVGLGQ